MKYEEVTRLGHWFADRFAEIVARDPEEYCVDVVVPVPLPPARQQERGYKKANRIARALANRLGIQHDADLLMRTKPRPARLVFSRKEHWESVRGAYATRKGLRVDKLRVLLVDDVMMTGATLDACSRALRNAGAASVVALTVARGFGLGTADRPSGKSAPFAENLQTGN
ncbi:MAG: phosphoribosyltransferase family protein [Candidatus Acidiferrales bacterium]